MMMDLSNFNVWQNSVIRRELKNIYGMHNNNEVNDILELNLLDYILNPSNCEKFTNSFYYLILNVCINMCRCKVLFKNFEILLDSGFSSIIVIMIST